MIPSIISAYEPLDINEISVKAPAIMTEHPFEGCKKSYAFISTRELMNAMIDHDFLPFSVHQSRSRDKNNTVFAKHAICFRHVSTFDMMGKDIVPQVVILNSHDRTTAYKIFCGFFRFVCSNGLIVGDMVGGFSVRHKGTKAIDDVIDASFKVLDNSVKMLSVIDDWKKIELNNSQRMELAYAAHDIKFGTKDTPITPEMYLTAHNTEDGFNPNTLWNTFNIVQENLIKGGLVGYNPVRTGKKRERIKVTTRSINNVTQNIGYNTRLWNAAEDMFNRVSM